MVKIYEKEYVKSDGKWAFEVKNEKNESVLESDGFESKEEIEFFLKELKESIDL